MRDETAPTGLFSLSHHAPQEDLMTQDISLDLATGLTPGDYRRAALVVCDYAADAAEAAQLLEALGLLEIMREQRLTI